MSVEQANLVADKISQLNKEYNSRLVSNEMQILRPYLQSMENLALLRTIHKESQPFALALTLSSIGILKSDSELGIIGPSLEKVMIALSEGINALQPDLPVGNKKILKDGSLIVIAGIMTLAAIGSNEGTTHSLYDEEAQSEINRFSLELLFEMGLYSNIPEHLFQTLAEVAHYTKANEIASGLTLAALLLSIGTLGKKNGPKTEILIENSKPKIIECLNKIESIIPNTASEVLSTLLISLKQIRFSIESNDNSKLMDTITKLPEICGVKFGQLEEDIQEICKQTKIILGLLGQRIDEDLNTVTGMWQMG
jgi:hypothetical protein